MLTEGSKLFVSHWKHVEGMVSLMVRQRRQDVKNPRKWDTTCGNSMWDRRTSLSACQVVGGKRLEIGRWKSEWLQEPNVNKAGRERKVTRETMAVLVAEIQEERLAAA